MMITNIQYGNPDMDVLPFLNGRSFLDILFAELSKFSFPANDSANTREELNRLTEMISQAMDNKKLMERYYEYDENLYAWFHNQLFPDDEEKTKKYRETVDLVFQDVLPLVYKLKMHHNRPRPFQLAGYHKLRLFPHHSYSVNSPAFPSRYSCVGTVLCAVLGNHYPEMYEYFKKLQGDIGFSRLYMGLNLQSDVDAGGLVANKILENKEFKIKYAL